MTLDTITSVRYHCDIKHCVLEVQPMPDVLVRDVDESALAKLKARAQANGRSLGAELKRILE